MASKVAVSTLTERPQLGAELPQLRGNVFGDGLPVSVLVVQALIDAVGEGREPVRVRAGPGARRRRRARRWPPHMSI